MSLSFDPHNPFPLIDLDSVSYREQQTHSELVDDWLGLKIAEIEEQLVDKFDPAVAKEKDERHWIGLPAQSLLTPYTEIRFLLSKLPVQHSHVVDLGAGYGRMAFVIARHFPATSFLGIEVVSERVREGADALARVVTPQTPSLRLIQGDLVAPDFAMPVAEIYFLYDFGSLSAIEKTLADLARISREKSIVVVGRGGATRNSIDKKHGWLSQVIPPEHFRHFSVYRSS